MRAVYEVVQEHKLGSGKFNCIKCQAIVFSWNGYDPSTNWLPLLLDRGK